MASDLQWVPHFCLTCDKQTDGATYCSESCRLADYEETSSFSSYSDPNSPSWSAPATTYPWSSSTTSRKSFNLTPAYDFTNPQPYGTTPGHYHYSHNYSSQYTTPRRSAMPTSALYSSASTPMLLPPTASASAAATTSVTYHHVLSPSSSHSSLSSMRSNLSSGGAMGALTAFASGGVSNNHNGFGTSAGSTGGDLTDRARSELRKYASSLEQGKLQRRRSC